MEPTDDPIEPSSSDLKGDQGDQGDRGKRGIQGVQGVQGLIGPPGEPGVSATSEGTQGVQGIQGIQGTQGQEGKRGFSAQGDDIPSWLIKMLKLLLPAYFVLALAVASGFYVGFRFSAQERDRICDAINKVTLVQVNALINASSEPLDPSEPPLTSEQIIRREKAIEKYRNEVNKGLALCHK